MSINSPTRSGSASDRNSAQDARIDEAIAQDVAVGMAEKADHERAKANVYATQAARKAQVAQVEHHNMERAQDESRSTKFTLWLVLGILAIGAIAALAYFMRPADTTTAPASAPVSTRASVPANPANPGMVMSNPNNTRTNNGVPIVPPPASVVVVPNPVPATTTSTQAAPIRSTTVSQPATTSNAPAATATAAPASSGTSSSGTTGSSSSNGTLQGYVEPTR